MSLTQFFDSRRIGSNNILFSGCCPVRKLPSRWSSSPYQAN